MVNRFEDQKAWAGKFPGNRVVFYFNAFWLMFFLAAIMNKKVVRVIKIETANNNNLTLVKVQLGIGYIIAFYL